MRPVRHHAFCPPRARVVRGTLFTGGLVLSLFASAVVAEMGVITWIHPQDDPDSLHVESAIAGVEATFLSASGETVRTANALRAAGWHVTDSGFWETPRRAGGRRLTLSVTNLPAGSHRVFFRYFSQPRVPGNEWWYITRAGIGDGKGKGYTFNQGRVIQGTGGYDDSTVYEAEVGTVGSDDSPVRSVSFWFERYTWSQFSRVGSVRIETLPSMHYSDTREKTPENDAIRAALLAGGPDSAGGARPYGIAVVSGAIKVRPKTFRDLGGYRTGRHRRSGGFSRRI